MALKPASDRSATPGEPPPLTPSPDEALTQVSQSVPCRHAANDADPAQAGPVPLELPAGLHHLCGCGRSRHGWFCDGAHLGSGRVSHELRLAEATTVLLCGCGRSGRFPLCDGRHARPPRRRWWWFRG